MMDSNVNSHRIFFFSFVYQLFFIYNIFNWTLAKAMYFSSACNDTANAVEFYIFGGFS